MQQYPLPGEGLIPALGLGTWKSASAEVTKAVEEAITAGYRHIDCAPIYGNEPAVGTALSRAFAAGTVSRQDLWLTSKLWNNAHGPDMVQPALEKTLLDLQVDYLDLFLIHWPVLFRSDIIFARNGDEYLPLDSIPIIDTWRALEACVAKGLTRYIGVCNFSIKKLDNLCQQATIQPVNNQIEMHPYLQQPEMVKYCQANNILLTAYSPLGSGDRPKGMKKKDEPSLLDNPVIQRIATRHKVSPGQVLISWGLARKTVVIPKSVHPQRIRENLAAAGLILDAGDLEEIATLDRGYRFVDGSFFQIPGSPYTVKELWDE
ncbi:aldo/keto reductase [Desulfobulbus alkaliphilus]|uniref:aldo/keto reductase n=1 Tax=Desulfobulbus alkaliphilus TaxID=869814 RepID=UPI001964F78D|nr:aldo/keto reductase [Desulfobulbus alkaliphilus]MBM9536733.1 aldo/keto reductase [Desulfobulbus alkaliphilus]